MFFSEYKSVRPIWKTKKNMYKDIVISRYKDEPYSSIAKRHNVTRERIAQLEEVLLKKIVNWYNTL